MNPSGIDANESVAHRSSGLLLKYLQRYALAILSVGVALGASLLLEHFHFRVPSALLLLFAAAISSWYAGPGPAVLAAILSTISFYWYFVEPVRTIYINWSEIPYFVTFTAFAALLSWFGTFRRRAEADLRQTHDQLKVELEERSSLLDVLREQASLLSLTHDAVYVRDMKGVIRYWNRGAEVLYGWPAEHAVGKVAHELLKTGSQLPFEQIEAELLRNGHWEGELVKTKKDGTQLVVASRWSLKRNDQGAPAAILVTSNDVTERKRAEEELREGETRFRTFVDHAGDAFFVLDQQQQGRVLDVNRQACESLGYTREELIGMAPHDFDPDVDTALLQGIRERIEDGGVCTFETRHRRKDGTAFPVEVRVRPLWHGGRRIHLALARDITERKRAEEALRRLNRELRAISNCNQTLLRATDEQSLLKEICRIVCEDAGYRMAWVGYAEHDEARSVRPVAWAGAETGYLATAGITWADTERGRGPGGTAIRSGEIVYFQDSTTDSRFAPWRESALQRGYRSGIVLPLKDEHANAFGCLCIYSEQPNAFTSEEIRLLEELAGDMAFGIITQRSRAARKQAEQEVALLSFALDNVREAAFLVDETGCFRYVNEEASRVLGYTRAELLGMAVPDIDSEFPSGHWPDHWRDLKTQRSLSFESRHRTRDGRVFPVEISGNYFEYGGRAYALSLVRDITERKRAEEEVRNTAAQWQATFDAVQDLVLLLDKDFRILRANHAAAEFLALPFDKLIGGHCYDLIHGMSTPPAECPLGKMRQSRRHEEMEVLARKGGPWLSVSVDPLFDPSGEIAQVVHVARDITERKRAEQILRQSEVYLAEAQRLSHTGSWAFDVATRKYIYWSEELFRIFGFDPQGGIGSLEEVIRRFHPEDLNRWKENFERSLREKVDTSCECRFMMPDGTVKLLHLVRHPVLNDAGEVVQLIGTTMDITERKVNEEALRRSEAYLAEAERINDTGTWAWNPASGIQYWSKQCYRIMGFDPADGVPRLERFLERVHPEDLPRLRERLQRVAVEKTNYETEYRVIRPSGEVRDLRVIGRPVFDSAGNLLEYVGTSIDITERKRNEEALRRSGAYLADAHRLTHTGAWAGDPTTSPVYWSEEVFRLFGFDPQHGLPTRDEALQRIHPEDLDNFKHAFDRVIHEKIDSEVEFRIVLPDGIVKHVHAIGHPVLDANGEVVEVVGTTVDITDRKRAEQELLRSEAYLNETQRLTHTGSWAYDPAGGPIYWSEEMFRIYAFDPRQGFPTRAQRDTRIHPEDLENVRQARHKMLHKKVDSEFEHRIVLPDGRVRHVHVQGHPVLNPAGEVLETVGTTVDITDRKRAEQELRESEIRFRTFVDHAGDALFVYDLEQRTVVDVNREACESLGYTRQELVGNTPAAYHLDSYQAEMESVAQRAMAGETVFDTHWHLRKDGTVFPVEVHTTLVSYTGRRFLLMVARDISDRLQAEEQRKRLRQLEADMAHIARVSMMGELAASIAHEVNQPLSGIVSSGGACLRWLAADPPNLGEVREAVRRIVGAGKHAGEVIARIRALTKRTAAPQEKLDLNETIREVLPLVGDEAKRNKVMIRTQFADDISPILGDQVQVQQVVLNLVMNGIEAMSSVGERERELVIITRNIDPEQVQVTVEDSGIGIDPNTIQKIFDPFYTTKSTGMGMGLSISRSILQHHGGRLWATAKDGPGTSFHFTLPKYHEEESNAGV